MVLLTVIVLLSILVQFASAIMAVRLISLTGRRVAWLLIALAIALMMLRRVESLAMLLAGAAVTRPLFLFEIVGLITSVVMLAGIYLIRPMFAAIVRSEGELRTMNEKLTVLSQEQKLLLDYTKDLIFRHDPAGIMTYVSPAVERLTGFSPAEWLVNYTKYHTDKPVNRNGREITDAVLTTGTGEPAYVVEVEHKNGSAVWLEINKQPYIVDGRVAGFIGVARDITGRIDLEREREKLIADLQDALAHVRTLKGMLPICASCKKVRDDKGYWNQIEAYVSEHSEAEFTHAICPECAKKLYPGYYRET
jgi:PAS domain S-box-containing protein